MRSPMVVASVILALALPFARSARGGSDDAALRTASGLVWQMTEWRHEFSDRRRARGVTPDEERQLAEAVAGKFASHRNKLAALLPKLTPNTRFATDLAKFVEAWPTRDAFLQDFSGPTHGEKSGMAVSSLAMQVSDPRRGWKTLFPFFRP
jgi:hypothetical protein